MVVCTFLRSRLLIGRSAVPITKPRVEVDITSHSKVAKRLETQTKRSSGVVLIVTSIEQSISHIAFVRPRTYKELRSRHFF